MRVIFPVLDGQPVRGRSGGDRDVQVEPSQDVRAVHKDDKATEGRSEVSRDV